MFITSFFIPCIPTAKGRPKFTRMGWAYTPAKTRSAEAEIRFFLLDWMAKKKLTMIFEPVSMEIVFYMPAPKVHKGETWHAVRPDLDNLEKLLLDSMNGMLLKDDALVCYKISQKRYAVNDKTGIFVSLESLDI
jgi:Holliday junction resolvase RusA-like endonuclease